MKNKKNAIISIGFVTIIIVVFIVNLIKPDEKISISERRKLAQFPNITVKEIFNGNVFKDFEKYAIDQYIGRDLFRSIKILFNFEIYRQKDNNGLFIKDDVIYKIEYPTNENAIEKTAKKINQIKDKYLEGMNVYYSIIPDKNYFLDENYLKLDYKKMQNIMKDNLTEMKYIDIFNELDKKDYYRTDIHWEQENIRKVINKIEIEMSLKDTSKIDYEEIEIGDFYGTFYGQIGIPVKPDKIKYLTNETIENCTTYNYEIKKESKVYDLEKYKKSADKYDIYLSGPTSLIEINNPKANNEKELILFRDSFGSSIAPLLIENYKKITLIDIRYIDSNLLEKYIDFKDQDVLFLYSSLILNQTILK